jgi:hypothetical protein
MEEDKKGNGLQATGDRKKRQKTKDKSKKIKYLMPDV